MTRVERKWQPIPLLLRGKTILATLMSHCSEGGYQHLAHIRELVFKVNFSTQYAIQIHTETPPDNECESINAHLVVWGFINIALDSFFVPWLCRDQISGAKRQSNYVVSPGLFPCRILVA